MHTMASEDTEITLGVGRLLVLFFLLAAICGIFFSIGYSLGRNSGREQAANDQTPITSSADGAAANSATSESKPPGAVVKPESVTPSVDPNATAPKNNLTFYKAVQQNDTETAPATAGAKRDGAEQKIAATPAAAKAPTVVGSPVAASGNPDVMAHTSPVTGPGTIVVQIAALSREDDAVSLAGALRKKNYNVFVVNNPVNNDKFYHVQVGPFANLADAEAMKAKLVAEGYKPIIKR